MVTQKYAERFVITWASARSVREVTAELGEPVAFVIRVADYLVAAGVNLPHLPATGPDERQSDIAAAVRRILRPSFN